MLPFLKLLRLPNVFTAIADILMGFLYVHGSLQPTWGLALLALTSASLYCAGMALNDCFDYKVDCELRPERVIPSGQIALRTAWIVGLALLADGVLYAAVASWWYDESLARWRPLLVATLLALAILLYDGALKRTIIAPLLMGSCRALNILLGMSLALESLGTGLLGFEPAQLVIAGGIGIYVSGITWFARDESTGERTLNLTLGMAVMIAGLALLAFFHRFPPFSNGERQLTFRLDIIWPLTVLLLGFSTLRRCLVAFANPSPQLVQVAVKQCILSLIVFDAAVTMAVCSGLVWPVIVLALMVPFLWLGKWIRST